MQIVRYIIKNNSVQNARKKEEKPMIAEKVKELEEENQKLRLQVERLQEICNDRAELPKNCEYCNHFLQHYIRSGGEYQPTCDGHCIVGNRVKSRRTVDTCKFFEKKAYGKNVI